MDCPYMKQGFWHSKIINLKLGTLCMYIVGINYKPSKYIEHGIKISPQAKKWQHRAGMVIDYFVKFMKSCG